MVSFVYLHEADLRPLSEAADSWEKLPAAYRDLRDEFTRQVVKRLENHWEGEAAEAAFATMRRVRQQYDAAATEARRTAKLLRDAHTEFAACRKRLRDLMADARKQNLHISEKGEITDVDPQWQNPMSARDEEYKTARRKVVATYSARITRILELATAADAAAAAALNRDANGKDNHAFNTSVYTSLDAVEADQAARLMRKKGRLTDAEREQLSRLLSANRNDPEFARRFVVRAGAENILTTYNGLLNPPPSTDRSARLLTALRKIERDLGTTLATATTSDDGGRPDPGITRFQRDLLRLGPQEFRADDNSPTSLTGYQLTSSLLRQGRWDTDFLQQYGEDLLTAEKTAADRGRDPRTLWSGVPPHRHSGTALAPVDPMTGFMDALGHNPEAATAFLNGSTEINGETVDHLDYLWEERQWPKGTGFTADPDHPQGYHHLSHAMEAATTGHPFDTNPSADLKPHTHEQAELASDIINKIARNGDLVHDGMHESLGQLGGEYMPEIHRALSADTSNSRFEFYPTAGADLQLGDADWADDDGTEMGPEQTAFRFLVEVSREPDGFAPLKVAQSAYVANLVDYHLQHPEAYAGSTTQALKEIARTSGEFQGAIVLGSNHGHLESAAEEDEEHNAAMERAGEFAKGLVGTGVGIGTSFIATPAVGAGASGLATSVAGDIIDQVISDLERDSTDDVIIENGRNWEDAQVFTKDVIQRAHRDVARQQSLSEGVIADQRNELLGQVDAGFGQAADTYKENYGEIEP